VQSAQCLRRATFLRHNYRGAANGAVDSIDSVPGVLIAAIPIGMTGGIACAAYVDLLIRSCPEGQQGTILMMAGSMIFVDFALRRSSWDRPLSAKTSTSA
jgi:energy-converting hydrogenase Eha subunit C